MPESESAPRRPALSHGPEADALLDEVQGAMGTLALLLSHGRELGAPETRVIRDALEKVAVKLDRRELRVVVVGDERSGKSTFLDALLGERLLGMAKTPQNTVTTVRSKPELGYRARLTDGLIDDFAVREPDRTAELLAQIASADARSASAKRRSGATAVEVAAAADTVDRVESAMTNAFRAFESARGDAERCSAKLSTAEEMWGRLVAEAGEHARALPVLVRPRPPWWAFWSWIVRFIVLLTSFRAWRRHRALMLAGAAAENDVDRLRTESSRAAERCRDAEAALATVNTPVEEARKALETTHQIQKAAEAEGHALGREVLERRLELERERSERKHRFLLEVRALANIDDRGKDVVDLEIDFPARLLPDDIVLIETPGITSEDAQSSERAWRAIRERADACILVSELERAVSGDSQKFLQRLREIVPHAVLVLTKMDETFAEGTHASEGKPGEETARARRIGTRRFAREMGRDPTTVLSIAVAAEEAFRGDPSADPARLRFETDVATLFTLLRYERALILGASSAGIVRRCIGSLAEAEARARALHRDRITALEAQRIPAPEQFYREHMASVEGAIAEKATSVLAYAPLVLKENADVVRVECKAKIAACKSKGDLRALAPELSEIVRRGMSLTGDAVKSHLDAQADRAVGDLETSAFQALRERYQLLHEIGRPADVRVLVHTQLTVPDSAGPLAAKLSDAVRSFDRSRLGFGAGGVALGAGLGTLVLPGVGSLAGALVGGLATFARTLDALKRNFDAAVDEIIGDLARILTDQIAAAGPSVTIGLRTSLAGSLEHTLTRFARSIEEPIKEERAALESERAKLHELEALHGRLEQHDARLELLIKRATDASVGLCR